MKKIFAILFLAFATIMANAQEANLFYFNPHLPQASFLNPSFHNTQTKVVAGVAGLNGFYLNLSSDATISDMFVNNENGSTTLDVTHMINNLNGNSEIDQHLNIPMLYFGLNLDENHFYFSASQKQSLNVFFNDDLITLFQKGNINHAGKELTAKLDISQYHYGEYAFGYSRDFMENRLTVGVAAKLLFGKSAFVSDNITMGFYTSPEYEHIRIRGNGGLYAAGPFALESDEMLLNDLRFEEDFSFAEYLTSGANPGFGFDIGAQYQVNEKIRISASLIDMGGIKWKNEITGFNMNGEFNWYGEDISDVLEDDFETGNGFSNLGDSLLNSFALNSQDVNFTTPLQTKLYVGGLFNVNENLDIGVLNRMQFNSTGTTTNMFMVSANSHFGDYLSLTGSYAVTRNSYDNLGLGVVVRAGFAQFVLGTDNIIRLISLDKARYTSIRFGINFLFGQLSGSEKQIRKDIDDRL